MISDEDRVLLLGGRDSTGKAASTTWIWEASRWRRGPELPHALSYPHAWCGAGSVFVAGDSGYGEYVLLELSPSLEPLREHAFRWPHPDHLHVDRLGRLWRLVNDPPPLPGELELGMRLPFPSGYPTLCELRGGALLAWSTGGPDRPRRTTLWRLSWEGPRCEPLVVVPTGSQGLTSLWLELPSGELLLLTVQGDLIRVDAQSGEGEILASLDEDKSTAFWAGSCLARVGEDQIVVVRAGEARRVELATGAVHALQPPAQARFQGSGVLDADGELWLVGGFSTRREGLPPERFPLRACSQRRKRRPRGISVLFPEGPQLVPEVGAQVRLKSGPFANLIARVLRHEGDQLLIELSLFGRTVPMRVALSETELL